ncbi:MAG: hypothetical protein LBD07_01620 [Spirochaetaceae bacterium]|jgi:hypothetical protein|nr:hypothetical protein [Spirochaetaceae bacterium]
MNKYIHACFWGIILFAGCSWKAPSAITFFSSDGEARNLTALSKRAQSGFIPLGKTASYNYTTDSLISIPHDSSFSVSYKPQNTLRIPSALSIEFEKDSVFALPADISFLQPDNPQKIRYAMPVNSDAIQKITVNNKNTVQSDASVTLFDMKIEPRRYGYSRSTDEVFITPFLHGETKPNGGLFLRINPPEYNGLDFVLQLNGLSGGVIFGTDDSRFKYLSGGGNSAKSITIPAGLLTNSPAVLFEGESDTVLLVKAPRPVFPNEPVSADPGVILAMPQSSWRNARYEIYCWDIFPSVLIFDISDYDIQDRMFKRLAFFSEKKGYRGKIVSDAELEDKHGWNAHDYDAVTLAAFFNAVKKISFTLLPEEQELEHILTANSIISVNTDGTYKAGKGAIVSVSRGSDQALRARFMAHECFHGIFFIDEEFRNFAARRYAALDTKAKSFLRSYFDYLAYDISDSFLLLNEFMAYCLQQSARQSSVYFGKQAPEIIEKSDWRKSVLPPKDEETESWPLLASVFSKETEAFSEYVKQRWDLAAGRVWRIRSEK